MGKGSKTRTLPLGSQAIVALKEWLELRPSLLTAVSGDEDSQAALFLGARGKRISPRVVQLQLNRLATLAGLPLGVHPHSLRHSLARRAGNAGARQYLDHADLYAAGFPAPGAGIRQSASPGAEEGVAARGVAIWQTKRPFFLLRVPMDAGKVLRLWPSGR